MCFGVSPLQFCIPMLQASRTGRFPQFRISDAYRQGSRHHGYLSLWVEACWGLVEHTVQIQRWFQVYLGSLADQFGTWTKGSFDGQTENETVID